MKEYQRRIGAWITLAVGVFNVVASFVGSTVSEIPPAARPLIPVLALVGIVASVMTLIDPVATWDEQSRSYRAHWWFRCAVALTLAALAGLAYTPLYLLMV